MDPARVDICDPGHSGGTFLPLFGRDEQEMDKITRAMIYLAVLLYFFFAVNIAADYFMNAVERITSRRIRVMDKERDRLVTKHRWNDTIANLSLLALGSSAPEILLASVETASSGFYSGALGPNTIVGSASFNLFVIIAVCNLCIAENEVRKIDAISVFHVTAAFSLAAYFWLYMIVSIISPDIIEIWEATLTFIMFWVLLVVSYAADRGKLEWRASETSEVKEIPTIPDEASKVTSQQIRGERETNVQSQQFRMTRIAQNITRKGSNNMFPTPSTRVVAVGKRARCTMVNPRAFKTRHTPTKSPGSGVMHMFESDTWEEFEQKSMAHKAMFGEPRGATCMGIIEFAGEPIENDHGVVSFRTDSHTLKIKDYELEDQTFDLEVRRANEVSGSVTMRYTTEALDAVEDVDFESKTGTLKFDDQSEFQFISIRICGQRKRIRNKLIQIILQEISDGADFNPNHDGDWEEEIFTLTLEPQRPETNHASSFIRSTRGVMDAAGSCNSIERIRVTCQSYFTQVVESAKYWPEEEADVEDIEVPGWGDFIMHVITFPWKILFAVICPPVRIAGGWLLFFAALIHIGLVTAFVADLAALFGCCSGLGDEVTAITIVALGTSLPDMFASMALASRDSTADASIINVTGSNSVNVFLGLGVPWTLASVYWKINGPTDEWRQRYPVVSAKHPDGAFIVIGDSIGFSVYIFLSSALCALALLRFRRLRNNGELGGPNKSKWVSSGMLCALWCSYIILSVVKANVEGDHTAILYAAAGVAVIAVVTVCLLQAFGSRSKVAPDPRISNTVDEEDGFFPCKNTTSELTINRELCENAYNGHMDVKPNLQYES